LGLAGALLLVVYLVVAIWPLLYLNALALTLPATYKFAPIPAPPVTISVPLLVPVLSVLPLSVSELLLTPAFILVQVLVVVLYWKPMPFTTVI
jgi:hypothetical protein